MALLEICFANFIDNAVEALIDLNDLVRMFLFS